ncbi:UBP-type zinc finger domain-containing protein [Streptomyces sp. G-G2]|uniref:UBP-type zinc finger domain-containing protein n=1 Tax=Streptomyces sp. G-G2 TaxID=3046201 RepID=UPI0024BB4B6F|nr:UBP-type zinc finger domain-containing protein [Streptomyces sp. G-G2]MDJ0385146.1 UBP-type zinc finger domain-containing protein [Streptomyces sp. G-G2]
MPAEPPAEPAGGCAECLASGGAWVHLRACLLCGHLGCCDSSPGRHAWAHADTSGHALARSAEPGESWAWCYADELFLVPDSGGVTDIG